MYRLGHVGLGLAASSLVDPSATPLVLLGAVLPDYDLRYGIPHRGPTHSIFLVALLAIAAMADPGLWFLKYLALGVATHIIGDLITGNGVSLLWPINNRRIGIRLARSGDPALNAAMFLIGVALFGISLGKTLGVLA